jgi:hypothetical protein
MNKIPASQRAEITAIVGRVVSELGGGDPNVDRVVADAVSSVIYACYQLHVPGDPRTAIDSAIDLTTEKDWLFTVRKLGNSFEFEVAFGSEMKAAKLKRSVRLVREAGVN